MVKRLSLVSIILAIIIIAILSVSFKFNMGLNLKGSNAKAADEYITKNTKHFSIEYKKDDKSADKTIDLLEKDYDQVDADLKLSNLGKIKVKIYTDREEFNKDLAAIKLSQISNVVPIPFDKIYIREPANNVADEQKSTTNLIILSLTDYVVQMSNPELGYKGNWLVQGLQVFELQKQTGLRYFPHYKDNKFPSLSDLNLNAAVSDETSYTLVQYISNKWGMSAVTDLIKTNGDITKTLNISEDELEKEWHQYLEKIN